MFERSPGFLLSKEQYVKTMAIDKMKFVPAEKKMTADELKEWAMRRLARAKIIENLGEYECFESSDWKGEVPHNFMRHMREFVNFDSFARTPFNFQGQKNRVWTVVETSSSNERKVIRFYTLRNSREIPFTFVLEKVKTSSEAFNLFIQSGAQFANQSKLENDVKQFFASTRHLYDFITTELWAHIDAMPPIPTKDVEKNESKISPLIPTPSSETRNTCAEVPKIVGPPQNSRESNHSSSDHNMRGNNGNRMHSSRYDQGYSRGGVIYRGSNNPHVYNNSYHRDVHRTNSTTRSSRDVNNNWRSHNNSTNSSPRKAYDAPRYSGTQVHTNYSPSKHISFNTNWSPKKGSSCEDLELRPTQGNKLEPPKDMGKETAKGIHVYTNYSPSKHSAIMDNTNWCSEKRSSNEVLDFTATQGTKLEPPTDTPKGGRLLGFGSRKYNYTRPH